MSASPEERPGLPAQLAASFQSDGLKVRAHALRAMRRGALHGLCNLVGGGGALLALAATLQGVFGQASAAHVLGFLVAWLAMISASTVPAALAMRADDPPSTAELNQAFLRALPGSARLAALFVLPLALLAGAGVVAGALAGRAVASLAYLALALAVPCLLGAAAVSGTRGVGPLAAARTGLGLYLGRGGDAPRVPLATLAGTAVTTLFAPMLSMVVVWPVFALLALVLPAGRGEAFEGLLTTAMIVSAVLVAGMGTVSAWTYLVLLDLGLREAPGVPDLSRDSAEP